MAYPKYFIKVKQEFTDIITGEQHREGNIVEISDLGRLKHIILEDIGSLYKI